MPPSKVESSTKFNGNAELSSLSKLVRTSKMKLPRGVLPIPLIMDQDAENVENERTKEKTGKNEEPVQNSAAKKKETVAEVNSKEKDPIESDNIDPPYPALPPNRHVDDQIIVRRQNGNRFRVKPGVQEIGEELNPIDRLAGLDDVGDKHLDAVDDQYVGAEYEPQVQPKAHDLRLAEGEEEEDEDDPDDTI
ncbi:hypothetical protein KPH14_010069 [Odynerus spinipes]|uniref:Uncharacterized protein n=1 Tax=Odynerus spinipes TaxID=1348599 RepID=A0AAD9VTD9_9HYME|nr:hypothetical protein KPH14_010069 [Odynerus spinipes]